MVDFRNCGYVQGALRPAGMSIPDSVFLKSANPSKAGGRRAIGPRASTMAVGLLGTVVWPPFAFARRKGDGSTEEGDLRGVGAPRGLRKRLLFVV